MMGRTFRQSSLQHERLKNAGESTKPPPSKLEAKIDSYSHSDSGHADHWNINFISRFRQNHLAF